MKRQLGIITTGLAALVLAGCGDGPSTPRHDVGPRDAAKRTTAILPADCERVVNVTRSSQGGYPNLTYLTTSGELRTQEYEISNSYTNIVWKKGATQPEQQVPLPADCATPVSVTKIQAEHYLLTYKTVSGVLKSQDMTVMPDRDVINWVPAAKQPEKQFEER